MRFALPRPETTYVACEGHQSRSAHKTHSNTTAVFCLKPTFCTCRFAFVAERICSRIHDGDPHFDHRCRRQHASGCRVLEAREGEVDGRRRSRRPKPKGEEAERSDGETDGRGVDGEAKGEAEGEVEGREAEGEAEGREAEGEVDGREETDGEAADPDAPSLHAEEDVVRQNTAVPTYCEWRNRLGLQW